MAIELSGDEYYTEDEAAAIVHRKAATMKRWRAARVGPPVTYIGKTPYYRKEALRGWIRQQERQPKRQHGRATA